MRCCQILCVSAETLKACALIGLHLMAADHGVGSSGSHSPDLGETCGDAVIPKSPDSNVAKALLLLSSATTTWEASEFLWCSDQSEGSSFCLQDWNLARVAFALPHRPGYAVPGNAGGLAAGLLLPRGPFVTASSPLTADSL